MGQIPVGAGGAIHGENDVMPNSSLTFINYITAIGTIATPILLIVISAIGWYLKSRIEASWNTEAALRRRAEKLEEAIRDDRLQVYNEILEPFIILFAKEEGLSANGPRRGKTKDQNALEILQSLKYRQTAFKLSLFANDDVVKAYNNLMQFSYKMGSDTVSTEEHEPIAIVSFFGDFLLEIRKSVGNETSSLSNIDMLTWMIKDIDSLKR